MRPALPAATLLVLLSSTAAPGQMTYHLDARATGSASGLTWDDAFTDLHDALLTALPGDTIRIAGGTYTPDIGGGFVPGDRFAFWRYGAERLEGGYAGLGAPAGPQRDVRDHAVHPTILSGEINDPAQVADNSHRLMWSQTALDVLLDGLTITACNQNAAEADTGGVLHAGFGGAMSFLFAQSYDLRDLTFTDNHMVNNLTTYKGGSALFLFQGSGTMTDCSFTDNGVSSDGQGNTVAGALYLFTVDLDITDCVFERNENITTDGTPSNWGGAVYLEAGTQTFDRCVFRDNRADGWLFSSGGAVFGWVNSSRAGTATWIDCTFEGNFAQQGSCLWLWDSRAAGVAEQRRVVRAAFRNNDAAGSNGGVAFLQPGLPIAFDGCLFVGNTIDTIGNPNNIAGSGVVSIANSTMTRDDPGASVRASSMVIDNAIIRGTAFGNQLPVSGSGTSPVTIRNSNISALALMPTTMLTTVDVIDQDPVFIDPAAGDFRLGDGSPCIDTGDNALVPGDLGTDLDNNPRIAGAAVDMGAYERSDGAAPCICERTGDEPASIDVFDLLAYLGPWFALDPAAELTGDDPASIDVFDLLAFLDCWFPAQTAPCP